MCIRQIRWATGGPNTLEGTQYPRPTPHDFKDQTFRNEKFTTLHLRKSLRGVPDNTRSAGWTVLPWETPLRLLQQPCFPIDVYSPRTENLPTASCVAFRSFRVQPPRMIGCKVLMFKTLNSDPNLEYTSSIHI